MDALSAEEFTEDLEAAAASAGESAAFDGVTAAYTWAFEPEALDDDSPAAARTPTISSTRVETTYH